jgi:anti-sigma factor RsiW
MADTKRDFSVELTAYIDGELPPDEARAVEAALAADPALRALERRLRRTVEAVEALPRPERAPQALRRNVLLAIERPSWGERLGAWLTPARLMPVGLAVAATAAAVVLLKPGSDEVDDEQLLLAQNLDVVEDLDLAGVESGDDLDVIANLHELEVER